MSEEDKKLMAQYDITSESKLIYSYKENRYENLKDAVNFAKLEAEDAKESGVEDAAKK
jgi:hypothetical protein